MVISVKSSKILTCIDLHHAASLDGGLDGCSSRLKAQYSQPSSPIFWKGTRGKKNIVSKTIVRIAFRKFSVKRRRRASDRLFDLRDSAARHRCS